MARRYARDARPGSVWETNVTRAATSAKTKTIAAATPAHIEAVAARFVSGSRRAAANRGYRCSVGSHHPTWLRDDSGHRAGKASGGQLSREDVDRGGHSENCDRGARSNWRRRWTPLVDVGPSECCRCDCRTKEHCHPGSRSLYRTPPGKWIPRAPAESDRLVRRPNLCLRPVQAPPHQPTPAARY